MELSTEALPKLELQCTDRTHFQMRIFLVFGCQDEDLKMVRKMAILHPQMAKFSASGGARGWTWVPWVPPWGGHSVTLPERTEGVLHWSGALLSL